MFQSKSDKFTSCFVAVVSSVPVTPTVGSVFANTLVRFLPRTVNNQVSLLILFAVIYIFILTYIPEDKQETDLQLVWISEGKDIFSASV